VASIDPRQAVFAALERRLVDGMPAGGWGSEEKLAFADVVHAYTAAAAHAAALMRSAAYWRRAMRPTSSPGRWTQVWRQGAVTPSSPATRRSP
jgi:hypothetical protein